MRNLQIKFNNLENQEPMSVKLNGHLTSMNAINFKKDLLRIITEKQTDCFINISELDAMDVSGVNALVMAHREVESKQRKMFIVSDSDSPAMEFLHLTKFSNYLNFKRA